jgi:hypothetical protein
MELSHGLPRYAPQRRCLVARNPEGRAPNAHHPGLAGSLYCTLVRPSSELGRRKAHVTVYYMNEGAFELPDVELKDRTTHVLEAEDGGHSLTLVVVRTALPEGKSLRQMAQLRVLDEMGRLSGYAVLGEREASWSGLPALEFASRWRHDGRAIYQQQGHLALGATWIYLALSAVFEAQAVVDAWFDRIRESFRLRSDT